MPVLLPGQHLLFDGVFDAAKAEVCAACAEEVPENFQGPRQTRGEPVRLQRAAQTESDGSGFTIAASRCHCC
jgi:hypothetical protein